ncbi:helix-turn-helix domain-containing protein [Pedobacter caeni]|uniref:AraC-type DNA-binding protein n=1 Tax=Pedobacter caeni TaxID=288992 RepID=A0A1M4TLN5_9SPHI|nr:helix-turn-helix domain-containing protein [Pedobacter caeni]SHE45306.1 AraC-type DNA-binding protein [Pedobacter caeni]
MKKQSIPIHVAELEENGIEIHPISSNIEPYQMPHRDDHYMFIIQQAGSMLMEVDFKEVAIPGSSLFFVAPGQVHRYLRFEDAQGWLLFVDTSLLSVQSRDIFSTYFNAGQIASVQKDDAVFKLVPLLEEVVGNALVPLREKLISSLTDSLTSLIASSIIKAKHVAHVIGGQKYNTVIRFKKLVAEKYSSLKQVKAYAEMLNISPLYLNEIAKEITGFPASYWISQEIILEARRMLYYTTLDVKQIAYALGYDDHAYFSRFFKKQVGMTALAFRNIKPLIVQS